MVEWFGVEAEPVIFLANGTPPGGDLCAKIHAAPGGVTIPLMKKDPITMLSYAITFLIIALIAGILGFGVIAGTAALIAKICFVLFLVLFLISFISGRKGPVA